MRVIVTYVDMSDVKFKQYYQLMSDQNQELFANFQKIHDGYLVDPARWEDDFHTEGRRVLDIARDWERRLCHGMERGRYANYSATLAEKFWGLVRERWGLIDEVGVRRN